MSEQTAFGARVEHMASQGIAPDYEMRDIIQDILKNHRPRFQDNDAKVSCKCGWAYTGTGKGPSNQKRYLKHVATDIELALTLWFDEEEKAAA